MLVEVEVLQDSRAVQGTRDLQGTKGLPVNRGVRDGGSVRSIEEAPESKDLQGTIARGLGSALRAPEAGDYCSFSELVLLSVQAL